MKANTLLTPLQRHGRRAVISSLLVIASVAFAEERTEAVAAEKGRDAATRANERIQDYREAATEVNKAEVKAALAELDAEIAHLDSLASNAPDKASRNAARLRVEALKDRRDELKGNYNQARFDQLKADVRREWNEFKGWVRSKTDRDRPSRNERPDTAATPRTPADYGHAPEAGATPVATTEQPTRAPARAENPAVRREHSKAALARVDQELELLEDRAEKLDTAAKEQLQARIDVLHDRRDDLEKNFSEERYTSLVREIQTELDRARSAAE